MRAVTILIIYVRGFLLLTVDRFLSKLVRVDDSTIVYICRWLPAHAAGGGGVGAAARALPAVARGDQEAHRGAHRARVPGAHARRPQGVHLRRIGA